ncbi:hypothetical protein PC116_g6789 [Phytophthora cactorum]|uniref:Uncharacterized protein n=1 Tax=Phytophthora cactorum TaxID=29920 RepID=A0A8T1GDY7_9STRA|nr:hypothetical protein Pcac1_g9177 [Phytophthora cactorum]KAG2812374.1 hypothetical protein PC111_g14838 [Phytophthora cactorum]KAG2839503.1 hypothetical protein PC112_g4083 [Phytophthora cactorum]KAG2865100.1 hypothetical protein PC113_g4010 [Phytophthora cactorum]KAG2890578.1 hypothetical protein PC114_g17389 [Phytophthora cactorum]
MAAGWLRVKAEAFIHIRLPVRSAQLQDEKWTPLLQLGGHGLARAGWPRQTSPEHLDKQSMVMRPRVVIHGLMVSSLHELV